jgi:glycine/D-amino acid oxidase-like deaminating enzyme
MSATLGRKSAAEPDLFDLADELEGQATALECEALRLEARGWTEPARVCRALAAELRERALAWVGDERLVIEGALRLP